MSTVSEETGESNGPQSFKHDYDAVIRVRYQNEHGESAEESVFAHQLVLSSFSPVFRQLLNDSSRFEDEMKVIELDLSRFSNALQAFKLIIGALYTDEVKIDSILPNEILAICRECQVTGIESKIMAASGNFNLSNIIGTSDQPKPIEMPAIPQFQSIQLQAYLNTMVQIWNNPLLSAFVSNPLLFAPPSPTTDESTSRTQSDSRSSGSSPRTNSMSTPPNLDMEKIVPNDDKEGWCRNKKYIEKVEGGFMCIVCRKIYGRYNSVSYHVTIYHRNPPIRCEENGCNFSTREARYIHFHKYYRHHIPLPENIDLGSRKCPYCRHVSKSPAMLEKHIARHDSDSGVIKKSSKDPNRNSRKPALDAVAVLPTPTEPVIFHQSTSAMKCTLCSFTTFGTDVLFMHLASVHAEELARLTSAPNHSDPEPAIMANTSNLAPLQLDTSI
ncbi:unnamed protein product [Caenorhabditis bovis]|uniref:BTB domain-containing protein n=1 Tax=Caenorhabditis bovis TaxID=2654633 RepID=A0A8S1EKQ8_9PELO|nr:unnamed protein product [Caenorhabditis bovis]